MEDLYNPVRCNTSNNGLQETVKQMMIEKH